MHSKATMMRSACIKMLLVFVYQHTLQNHNITAVLDIQRPLRARQLKV